MLWAGRSRRAFDLGNRGALTPPEADPALLGIVQGGVHPGLRGECLDRLKEIGFDGYAIGGLSVGEPKSAMWDMVEAGMPGMPPGAPRYLMGVGTPEDLVEGVRRGVDMFDCVWPTRLARHGRVLADDGDFNLRRAEFAEDLAPLSRECECSTCRHHHRAYLRHLLMTGELSAFRLISIHNLSYTLDLMRRAREAIADGTFDELRRDMRGRRLRSNRPDG